MRDKGTFAAFEPFLVTAELPSLGPEPRASREPLSSLEAKLAAAFKASSINPAKEDIIHSVVLLWHDYLNESHTISQDIHNADGSFAHAIMHRREPDYWNSKYWFNRVGQHPSFVAISAGVNALLTESQADTLRRALLPDGKWNPMAFVDLCQRAATARDPKETMLLQRMQQIEFRSLLEHVCRS